jgi:hypothetical protein
LRLVWVKRGSTDFPSLNIQKNFLWQFAPVSFATLRLITTPNGGEIHADRSPAQIRPSPRMAPLLPAVWQRRAAL